MAGFKPGPFQCYYPSLCRLHAKNSNVAKESVPRNSEKTICLNYSFQLLFWHPPFTRKKHILGYLMRSKYSVRCKQQGVRRNRFGDVPKGSWGIDTYKR